MLPYSLVSAATSMASGAYVSRVRAYRPTVWVSFAVYTLGMGLMTMLDADSSRAEQEIYPLIAGLGLGCLFQTPLIVLTAAMPPKEMASSTAAMALIRTAGGAIGISVAGSVFNAGVRSKTANITGYSRAGMSADTSDLRGLVHLQPPQLSYEVVHAYGEALRLIWIVMAPIVGFGFLCSLGLKGYSLSRKIVQKQEKEAEVGDPENASGSVPEIASKGAIPATAATAGIESGSAIDLAKSESASATTPTISLHENDLEKQQQQHDIDQDHVTK